MEPRFRPPLGMRSPHFQSLMNSSPIRRVLIRRRTGSFCTDAEKWLLDGGDGIRLEGFYSPNPSGLGLAILFHGWEGSAESNYLLSSAAALFNAGLSVFRLNFRDHGDSHHLNEEIFHSCRLPEVVNAVEDICRRIDDRPVYLGGFSLGGNFALRVAVEAGRRDIPLRRVVAVSPAINPHQVLNALERGPRIYERYFIRKWRRSLSLKQDCFPGLYDFSEWFRIDNLREQTAYLISQYTDFPSLEAYLDGYSVIGDYLRRLEVPTTIITAGDDPVIPVEDFFDLPENPALRLRVTTHGGHCGFLESWRLNSWIESYLVEQFRGNH